MRSREAKVDAEQSVKGQWGNGDVSYAETSSELWFLSLPAMRSLGSF